MERCSRRQVLGAVTTATVGLAGCTDDDPPEFLVTNSQIVGLTQSNGVRVRITIENEKSDRQEGILVVQLTHAPPDGDRQRWERTESISVGRGSSPRYKYVFSDVFESGAELESYSVSAEIRNPE